MSLRLQRRGWPHLQRFSACEVLGDLFEVVSAALAQEPLHLRPFATFRSKPHE